MPELEDVPDSDQTSGPPGGFAEETSSFAMNGTSDTIRNRHATESESFRRNNVTIPLHRANDIEPAFLNDRDYPPGWMVYHRVLGVVPKTEADRYDRESNGMTGMNGNHDASLNANGHSTGGSDAVQEEEPQPQILRPIAATG
jgi:hypothetical protein